MVYPNEADATTTVIVRKPPPHQHAAVGALWEQHREGYVYVHGYWL